MVGTHGLYQTDNKEHRGYLMPDPFNRLVTKHDIIRVIAYKFWERYGYKYDALYCWLWAEDTYRVIYENQEPHVRRVEEW
jgi:hypothetical protein